MPRAIAGADGGSLRTLHLWAHGSAEVVQPRGVVLVVDGPDPIPVRESLGPLQRLTECGVDLVLVEDRGIGDRGVVDWEVFHRRDTRQQREADYRAVTRAYSRVVPNDVPTYVLGVGAGGDVASRIAEASHFHGLILIGTGGGWTRAEQLRFFAEGCPDHVRQDGPLLRLEQRLEEIRANPESMRLWLGHSYRHWASYLWEPPLADLVTLDMPILMIHGEADRRVPVESAREVQAQFWRAGKTNLTYVEYAGVDHEWREVSTGESVFDALLGDVDRWLRVD